MGVEAMNARYSPKYFGTGKGISVLTLNANFIPLASRIISANEYEGNFILELLLMNESDIQPNIHSTDTHGTNEINFALLKLCGFDFAPRYKSLNKRKNIIFGKEPPENYNSNYILKPVKNINKEIIFTEEHNIKRVIASIMMKTSTVSTIVKKITHLPDSNNLKKAFVELDKIYRTTYILNYINNSQLR